MAGLDLKIGSAQYETLNKFPTARGNGVPVKPGEFVDGIYRGWIFKPANGGACYPSVNLLSIDQAAFDQVDPRQSERAAGTSLDAFILEAPAGQVLGALRSPGLWTPRRIPIGDSTHQENS